MGKLEFGTYDNFAVFEMETAPEAADVYEQHIQEVQLAELLESREEVDRYESGTRCGELNLGLSDVQLYGPKE